MSNPPMSVGLVVANLVSGRSGRLVVAFVPTVTVGTLNANSACGSAVPVGAPTVGTVKFRSLAGKMVPEPCTGGVTKGIENSESVCGISVKTGAGSSRTGGVHLTT